jgi:hypothetical protein
MDKREHLGSRAVCQSRRAVAPEIEQLVGRKLTQGLGKFRKQIIVQQVGGRIESMAQRVCHRPAWICCELWIRQQRSDSCVMCSLKRCYFFFPFAALARFSFTLNFTNLLISLTGIGLSSGNLNVPLPAA